MLYTTPDGRGDAAVAGPLVFEARLRTAACFGKDTFVTKVLQEALSCASTYHFGTGLDFSFLYPG